MCFIVFCKQCGFEIKDNSLKKCPKCNTTVGKGGRFCPDCGERLNSGEKCNCKNNINSEKYEPHKNSIKAENSNSPPIEAVMKQKSYPDEDKPVKKPIEVNKRIAGNPLLEKIARGENSDKSKEIIRDEAVKIVYGKDMTVDKLKEQRAAELKAEEEKKLAEQRLEEQRKAEEQRRIEEEKRIKEQKQAEEKKRIEAEKKRIEAEKQAQQINPAPPYPMDTLKQPQSVSQTKPQINVQNQQVNTQFPSQPIYASNSPNNVGSTAKNPSTVSNNPSSGQNNSEDSKNLFPEAFAPQNMSYQKPNLEGVQSAFASVQGRIVDKKSRKSFDGMWAAAIICTLTALFSASSIMSISLFAVSTVFGIIDIFINERKTGVGVVIGNIIALATPFLSNLI